MPYWIIGVFY